MIDSQSKGSLNDKGVRKFWVCKGSSGIATYSRTNDCSQTDSVLAKDEIARHDVGNSLQLTRI